MATTVDWRRFEVVDDAMADVYRRKSSIDRIAIALDANRTMRLRLEAHFRTEHPDWTDSEIEAAIARRLLGDAG